MNKPVSEHGLVLEDKVLKALRLLGATVKRDYFADVVQKNDYLIDARSAARFPYDGRVQLTLKIDDAEKLRTWLSHRGGKKTVDLYVQVESGVLPESIATCIIDTLRQVPVGHYCLYINRYGQSRLLTPRERLEQIEHKVLNQRKFGRKMIGTVTKVRESGIFIITETKKSFWAYDRDIADSGLLAMIKLMRETRWGVRVPPVCFIGTSEGRPHRRATDVKLDHS